MKCLQKLLSLVLALGLVPATSWAHGNVEVGASQIFTSSGRELSLEDVRAQVLNDQLDLRISYERLLQAQKKIAEARAQYFPYGVGTVAALYFLNAWTPLILIELVTSLPSKIYQVQSEKNMRWSAKYAHIALRENVKNQIATLYYTILKEEAGLALMQQEIVLMEELLGVIDEQIALGLGQFEDRQRIEIRLLDLRDIALRFESYLAEEKAAFNELIGQGPEVTLALAPVRPFLTPGSLQTPASEVVRGAVANSPEIVSAKYRIEAARRAKSSVQWSILSFSGLGFGHWSRVKVAGSKVKEAQLNKELVSANVNSGALVAYHKFQRQVGSYAKETVALDATTLYLRGERAMYDAGQSSLDRLIEVELLYLRDFSEWAIAHYDALIRLDDLARAYQGELQLQPQHSTTVH
jgi:outer membrane protein TolC